jgi:O-antigen ligase
MGLLRGVGPFAHPIHAGIFLGSFLPLYLLSGLRGWPKVLGVVASIGGAFSMSSAAMLALVVGGALCIYNWLTDRIANLTWRLFLFFTGLLYVGVELTSNSGFYTLLVRYASLNTGSAYNRILIWQYGTENIARHPWFGIGYGDWDRPDWMYSGSFDHFWLIMALRWGIPEALLLLAATIIAVTMLAFRSARIPSVDGRLLRGVAISLAVFALGVNSVSLWLNTLVWFFMLVGMAVSLGSTAQTPPVPRGKVPLRYAPGVR